LRLPKELGAKDGQIVEIEAQCDHWIVRPLSAKTWPFGFFSRSAFPIPRRYSGESACAS
jgi:hypothetical protein